MSAAIEITVAHARGAAQQGIVDAWLRMPAGDVRGGAADRRQRALVVEGPSFALQVPQDLMVVRLVAGCVCCVGQVPLRVAVTRSLRAMDGMRPRALLLLVSQAAHLPRLRAQIERGDLGAGIALIERDFVQD
ncbi:MAG: hypothetical protein ING59_06805 [Burkholderiales bacterium]|nr:hypothetical protein [Burkholderiales bacterium]